MSWIQSWAIKKMSLHLGRLRICTLFAGLMICVGNVQGAGECPLIHGEGEPLAQFNECGRLSYGLYANQGQNNAVHRLPDFSYAGYKGGGVALPVAQVVVTLQPGAGDHRARIQAAIDRVSELRRGDDGLRGAILLEAGTYEVSDTLYIRASGVVLRGEGQGESGTELVFTRREKDDLLVIEGRGDPFPRISAATRIRS